MFGCSPIVNFDILHKALPERVDGYALFVRGTVTLCLHISPLSEILLRRASTMVTILDLISVLGFAITCIAFGFAIGFYVGENHKK